MIRKAYDIYQFLEDTLSKDVFINKIMYGITGQYKYIDEIVDRFASPLDRVFNDSDVKRLSETISDCNKPLIIYGAGFVGRILKAMLPKERIECFCDMNQDLQGTKIDGISILSPEQIYAEKREVYVILAIWGTYQLEVRARFKKAGYSDLAIVDGTTFFSVKRILDNMYFDPDIIHFHDNEIFLDCGSYNFSTSAQLLERCKNVKKIFAFEPDESNYELCRKKISDEQLCEVELISAGVWNSDNQLSFHSFSGEGSKIVEKGNATISVVKIDSVLKGGKVTFIKMDIEGAELEALEGARETIQKYRPKLAISIYHKAEDIIEIPMFIKSLVSDYKIYIRHYTNAEVDTVLYAVI